MNLDEPILLVEDDTVDQMTVKRALRELNVTNRLILANNGEEALLYLNNHKYPKPAVILTDLNMPKMNGVEFLEILKNDEDLKHIPAIVLSGSSEDENRINSFNLGVAAYIVKPVDYNKIIEAVSTIKMYWKLSKLPG